jgi:hypothetical protein
MSANPRRYRDQCAGRIVAPPDRWERTWSKAVLSAVKPTIARMTASLKLRSANR